MEGLEAVHGGNPLLLSSSTGADDPMLSAAYTPADCPLSPFGHGSAACSFHHQQHLHQHHQPHQHQHQTPLSLKSRGFHDVDDDYYGGQQAFASGGHGCGDIANTVMVGGQDAVYFNGFMNSTKTIKYAAFAGFNNAVNCADGGSGATFMEDNLSPSSIRATSSSSTQFYDGHFVFSDEMVAYNNNTRHNSHNNMTAFGLSATDQLYPSPSLSYGRMSAGGQDIAATTSVALDEDASLLLPALLDDVKAPLAASMMTAGNKSDNNCDVLLEATAAAAASATTTVDGTDELIAFRSSVSFDCESPTIGDSSATTEPLSATTTVSSNCSASNCSDEKLEGFSAFDNAEHFTFLNNDSQNFADTVDELNDKKYSEINKVYGMSKRANFEFDNSNGFTQPHTSSYDHSLQTATSSTCDYDREKPVSTIRVITKYRSLPSSMNAGVQPYPLRTVKVERRYAKNDASGGATILNGDSMTSSQLPACCNLNDTSSYYDSTNKDTTVCSSKCSTPSSISSTINSVVVKSLNYSSASGYGSQHQTPLSYSAYAPLNSRPMNIIVNDMSAQQQQHHHHHEQQQLMSPHHHHQHHYDMKVEQPKFDYDYHHHLDNGNGCRSAMLVDCCATTGATPASAVGAIDGCGELDELNTQELAQRISQELKRYSIPQAIFAQRVLCRSQGTLSDLLRNPKPWSKLKSGRETFRRMAKWLQEPEFQRMSSLRIAACKRKEEQSINNLTALNNGNAATAAAAATTPQQSEQQQQIGQASETQKQHQQQQHDEQQPSEQQSSTEEEVQKSFEQQPKKQQQQQSAAAKKPRLVFTDIQRRTLYAIFKETKRPSREMQLTISHQLNLDPNTVANFFMNARRRGHTVHYDTDTVSSYVMCGSSDSAMACNGRMSLSVTPPFSSTGSSASTGSLSPPISATQLITATAPPSSWSIGQSSSTFVSESPQQHVTTNNNNNNSSSCSSGYSRKSAYVSNFSESTGFKRNRDVSPFT